MTSYDVCSSYLLTINYIWYRLSFGVLGKIIRLCKAALAQPKQLRVHIRKYLTCSVKDA